MSIKVEQLKLRVLGAAECVLEVRGYVSPIELLKQMGFLAPSCVRLWEKGVHDCLASQIQCGAGKLENTYREAGVKITFEVFHDRVVVTSPGLPAGGQSLTRIASGRGRSRSRNPLLAQGLAWLQAMEDRGTGIMRMTGAMLDHGLDRPRFASDGGCVVVTLPSPADNMDRIGPLGVRSQESRSA